jgi:ABC-type Na+ transport system ATPase subunit NatA
VTSAGSALRRSIGVALESLALLNDLTIEEHLFLSGPLYGLRRKDTVDRTNQLCRCRLDPGATPDLCRNNLVLWEALG